MSEPTVSAISPILSALRTLPIWILCGLALAGLAILYAPAFGGIDPSGFRKDLGVRIWVGTIVCTALAVVRLIEFCITSYATHRKARIIRTKPFIILAKTIHEKLLAYGKLNDSTYIDECIKRLEQSEDGIWVDDKLRDARNVFIDDARKAFQVRRFHGDYRARSETKEYLDNSKDRLVAALLNQSLPEFFDPLREDAPSLWQNLWHRRAPPNGWLP
ncbi:MAG: hypothetical protein WBS22_16760 [Methylocystis sp.]